VSFFTNTSTMQAEGGIRSGFSEFTTSASYQTPDLDTDGLEYGIDVRQSSYAAAQRPQRLSIYQGYVGRRFGGGTMEARGGHLSVNDLGSLGLIAGGLFEIRRSPQTPSGIGRWRVGVFGGLEPNIYGTGYAPNVKKYGAYVALDGERSRRHVVGYVAVRDASLTERSVLTTTNYLPIGKTFFLYQAAEYDLSPPAGQAQGGLNYFFANARFSPTARLALQGTYSRGRSIDTRGLSEDVLNGRPFTQAQVEGLLYQSIGGRATIEVVRRVRVYVGYSQDKNNREDTTTGRTIVGGYAANIMDSGFDVSVTDSLIDRPTGGYHSRYFSLGRQFGRNVYVSVDYTNSLSILRFSRSDGIIVELRPLTHRFSGTSVINISRVLSLLTTVDRTIDDQVTELRLMSGITYRFR
jgi:hypothetical protein